MFLHRLDVISATTLQGIRKEFMGFHELLAFGWTINDILVGIAQLGEGGYMIQGHPRCV